MNILIVSHYGVYQNLGTSFIHAQAKSYAELGNRVRVLIFIPFGKKHNHNVMAPLLSIQKADGVELYYLRFFSLSNFGKKWFNPLSALAAVRCHYRKLLEGFRPDIIHAHFIGGNSEVGAYLKKRLGCPLVLTTHGNETLDPFLKGDLKSIRRYANKGDYVVGVSTQLKNCLLRSGVTVPVSVILNGFRIQNVLLPVKKKALAIIQVGFLQERKKADITIQAFAQLHKKFPEATLEIVGSGSEMERYQLLCRHLKVEDAVHFHGFLSNSDALLEMAKATFFCMPSIREGFGIVYLEAMASGCVTIGTEKEGISDLIVNGVNGFLVPPDDPEAIGKVIEWCVEHPKEAIAIAERGRQDALNLTWEKNAKTYLSLFRELLKKNKENLD